MNRRLLLFWILLFISIQGIAQDRTIDGTSNNLQNTNWGAAGHQLRSITSNGFSDGIASPGGTDRPHPRVISNTIFAQDSLISDIMALSDFTWVFGQFIDHDVIATPSDPNEDASIDVNFPDVHFNPGGAFPFIQIHMNRSQAHPGTGTDINNPRGYTNDITSWIDGSGVYGSDIERANYLRSFIGGKLKTSAGNLLPFNTDTHEFDGNIDATAPSMENENPFNEYLFVAGDTRANENVALLAFHTIFVREHNRLCDELALDHPDWNDEELYQYARKMVSGFIQSITYNEWLPVMGVHLPEYQGYDSSIDPTISNVFSAAAFRLGHTLLNAVVPRTDNLGNTIPEGNLTLLEAFFAPYELVDNGGLDPIFKGLATQVQQKLDCKVVDDVRNFLFGPPQAGLGGLDLASININRGRERGLPDFNTIRQDMGLSPYASFSEVNSDTEVMDAMETLYEDVNDIDPWVGMLAEEHMPSALFGPTIMEIMEEQFYGLREGDRFYYENDPVLSEDEKEEINTTTFRDIIMRNTGITVMQMNVFEAMPHDSICPADTPFASVLGGVETFDGDRMEGASIEVLNQESGLSLDTEFTAENGTYTVADLQTCGHYDVLIEKAGDPRNGLTTFDIVLIRRHLLGITPFNNPYQVLSADVSNDGNVSTFDMIDMRRIILGLQDDFSSNEPWRFVDNRTTFADPNNPVEAVLDQASINYLPGDTNLGFVALKIGDVSGNANPSGLAAELDQRTITDVFTLKTIDKTIEAGETYAFTIHADEFETLAGIQFVLDIDQDAFSIDEIIPGDLNNVGTSNFFIKNEAGTIAVSWDSEEVTTANAFFTVNLSAKTDGQFSDYIKINQFDTKQAYTSELEIQDIELTFESESVIETTAFELYQNNPNPFIGETAIRFNLPQTDEVELVIYDLSGRQLYSQVGQYSSGINAISLKQADIQGTGILYYQLNTSFGSKTLKMVLAK